MTAAELDRADVRARRAAWLQERERLDPRHLVFLDETWAKTNMAPTHGRCWRGERLIARVPFGHWKTSTFLAALRWDGVSAPAVFDGPINGRSFTAYVEQVLAPTLRPGDVVVLDNLGSHKGKAARDANRTRRRRAPLPAALFARPQSHRAGLRQAQDAAATSRSPQPPCAVEEHRHAAPPLSAVRMPKLHRQRRIPCASLSGYRSKSRNPQRNERGRLAPALFLYRPGRKPDLFIKFYELSSQTPVKPG